MPVSSIQFGQTPWHYANGLRITNDATTPLTKLNVASGSIIDSTGIYQMISTASITINAASTGLNGIDTGVLQASKIYAVYLIADPVDYNPMGAMISLATTPLLPFGYSIYALVGYITTDSGVHFLPGYWTDSNTSSRLFMYDAPIATPITTGASTTYADVVLTNLVPAVNNLPVWIAYDMLPAAASRILSLTPFGGTGNAFSATSQVTSVHVTGNALVMSRLNSGVPQIEYKWSAGGGDSVALNVAGYEFFI